MLHFGKAKMFSCEILLLLITLFDLGSCFHQNSIKLISLNKKTSVTIGKTINRRNIFERRNHLSDIMEISITSVTSTTIPSSSLIDTQTITNSLLNSATIKLNACLEDKANADVSLQTLKDQVAFLKANNQDLINNMGNLTTLSQKGAESVWSPVLVRVYYKVYSMAARRAAMRQRNLAVGGVVAAFAFAMSLYPMFAVRRQQEGGLQQRDDSLSGSQIQRGQYLNTGSTDIGRDPDWDFQNNEWRGRRVEIKR